MLEELPTPSADEEALKKVEDGTAVVLLIPDVMSLPIDNVGVS